MFCLIGETGKPQVPQPDATLWRRRDVRQWSTPSVAPPIQVSPHPYESFESLIFRVAEYNAFDSASATLRALGAHCWQPSRYCYKHLSPLLGIEPASLAALIPTAVDGDLHLLGNQLLRDRHIVRHASRFCPLCVSERGYGALEWSLAPFAVCAEHGVYLVDRCACRPRTSLNMFRNRYSTCICGADLRNAAVLPASSAACKLAKEVRRRFRQEPDEQLDSVFPILTTWPEDAQFGDFLDLVICLGNLARGPGRLAVALVIQCIAWTWLLFCSRMRRTFFRTGEVISHRPFVLLTPPSTRHGLHRMTSSGCSRLRRSSIYRHWCIGG